MTGEVAMSDTRWKSTGIKHATPPCMTVSLPAHFAIATDYIGTV
jgi:hypothetical protein